MLKMMPDSGPEHNEEPVRNEKTRGEEPMLKMMQLLMEQKRAADLPILEPEVFKGDAARFSQ